MRQTAACQMMLHGELKLHLLRRMFSAVGAAVHRMLACFLTEAEFREKDLTSLNWSLFDDGSLYLAKNNLTRFKKKSLEVSRGASKIRSSKILIYIYIMECSNI